MKLNITSIPGDGIGPEIVAEAKKVLESVAKVYGHEIIFTDVLMGGCSIDKYGVPLTQETIDIAKSSDAVLMGSIGGNTSTSPWYKLPPEKRPEAGLLGIRKALSLFANLSPLGEGLGHRRHPLRRGRRNIPHLSAGAAADVEAAQA